MGATPGRARRPLAAALGGAVVGVVLLCAQPPAASAATGHLASIANGDNDARSDGLSSQSMLLTSGGPCAPTAFRHVAMVSRVTASDPADQPSAETWRGDLLYVPTDAGLAAGQRVVARTQSIDALALSTRQRVVAGRWDLVLLCQDSTGDVLDTWQGSVTFDSPDHWAADPMPVSEPGTPSPSPSPSTTTAPVSHDGVSLAVTPSSGPAYQQVTLTGSVDGTVAAGSECSFADGDTLLSRTPVAADGTCRFTTSALGAGSHELTVTVRADGTSARTSLPVTAGYAAEPGQGDGSLAGAAGTGAGSPATDGTVETTVPTGSLAIFTPYTPENPLDLGSMALSTDGRSYSASAPFDAVRISDTRAGDPGWSASLSFTDLTGGTGQRIDRHHLGFVEVTPRYVDGNAVTQVATTDIAPSPARADGAWEFARAAAGAGTGAVDVTARIVLRDVPTSTLAGRYTTTITFTVG